jgi:hypothetical protein
VLFVLLKSMLAFLFYVLKCFYFGSNCDDLSSCSLLMLIMVGIIFFSYIFIRRQQLGYLMPSYLLFNPCPLLSLSLNPSCASKIDNHVPMQIYSQTCLNVMVKYITNLLDNY